MTLDSPTTPTTLALFAEVRCEFDLKKSKLNFMPGIPGTYLCPPTPSGQASSGPYFVVTKGLYVGIFNNW